MNGQYPRTISVQVQDRYGRLSNTVSRNINVITGTIVYSNARPVKISNSQPLMAIVKGIEPDPSFISRFLNITTVDTG